MRYEGYLPDPEDDSPDQYLLVLRLKNIAVPGYKVPDDRAHLPDLSRNPL